MMYMYESRDEGYYKRKNENERERERARTRISHLLSSFSSFSLAVKNHESVKISFRGRSSTHVRASGRTIELQNKSLPSSNNS